MGLTETRAEIREDDQDLLLIDFFEETVNQEQNVLSITSQNIGTSFILAHPINGILGTAGVGLGRDNSFPVVLARRVNHNNIFREFWRTDEYIGTASTGTRTASAPTFKYDLDDGELLESETLYTEGTAVALNSVRVNFFDSTETTLLGTVHTYEASADGGSNWATIQNNVTYRFPEAEDDTNLFPFTFPITFDSATSEGNDLRVRFTANGTATIGKYNVSYTTR